MVESHYETKKMFVHVDLASDPEKFSNTLHSMATGWIKGSGFTPMAKPDAWCATGVANRLSQRW